MSSGKRITTEKVLEVKDFLGECPGARSEWVAGKCGVSASTVSKIRRGEYDHLLCSGPVEAKQPTSSSNLFEQAIMESLAQISAKLDEIAEASGIAAA